MPEAIIETAIGLFFVFLLMSAVSSHIVEWLASLRKWRATDLEKTVRSMLSDPPIQAKLDQSAVVLADQLYAHPLIASLAQPGSKPSYIPADKFALALFDVIATAGTDRSSIGQARLALEQMRTQLVPQSSQAFGDELQNLISQIQVVIDAASTARLTAEAIASLPLPLPLNDQLDGFLDRYSISKPAFSALAQTLDLDRNMSLVQILSGAARLSQQRPDLVQLVTTLLSNTEAKLADGETQLAAARRNVEQWFDDAMDRAGGWYKRNVQACLLIVGLALAIALNVDTLAIANVLWRDPTLRQSVIDQAQHYQLPATSDGTSISSSDQAAQTIRDLGAKLSQDLRFPIGWRVEVYALRAGEFCTPLPQRAGDIWGVSNGTGCAQLLEAVPNPDVGPIAKLIGLIITAIAVSQGAPFWFDLLQKLVNVRLTGTKPEPERQKTAGE